MKKVEVLEFTSYISPDGEEFKFDTSERFLMTEEGTGIPPITYLTQKGPFQHGETFIDFRLTPRTIQMQMRSDQCSRAAYWADRAKLLDVVRPNRSSFGIVGPGKLRKIFEDGSIRDIDVFIQQGPNFTARDIGTWQEWSYTETLRFTAYDPTYYDPVLKTLQFVNTVVTLDQLVFPFSFIGGSGIEFGDSVLSITGAITYPGTWLSFPAITVTGPISGFKITNQATGEVIELAYTIVGGEIVYITLPYGNKQVINDLGIDLNGTVVDCDFTTFHVAPKPEAPLGVNTFLITGSGISPATDVRLEYYNRYIGI